MTTAEERHAAQEAADGEDFTQFWADVDAVEKGGKRLRNVFGWDVQLPPSLPLRFEILARENAANDDPEVARQLVGLLFGQGALEHWLDQGLRDDQYATLLMWGSANASGHDMTLAQAREEARKGVEAYLAGNLQAPTTATGPNRAERRLSGTTGGASGSSGGPSSPTFAVSTGSVSGSWPDSQPSSSDFWSAASPNSRSGG